MATSGTTAFQKVVTQPFFCEAFSIINVYKITNTLTREFYIGVTKLKPRRRLQQHLRNAERGNRRKFYCAIRKYGEDAFIIETIETHPDYTTAFGAEIRLIAELKPQYNLTLGGEGVVGIPMPLEHKEYLRSLSIGNTYWVGRKHRPETIKIFRERKLGNTNARGKRTPETCAKISAAKRANPIPSYWLGKTRSQTTRERISKAKTGVPNPAARETFRKHGASLLAKAAAKNSKPIVCIGTGAIYACLRVLCEEFNLTPDKVLYALQHKKKVKGTNLEFVYEASS